MIKGVNKQILEVTNTENPYFEKIIFFVKPEFKNEDKAKLKREAEALSAITQKPPRIKKHKKQIIGIVINSLLFTGAGIAISYLINIII